jgi:hypothetical protein
VTSVGSSGSVLVYVPLVRRKMFLARYPWLALANRRWAGSAWR